MSEDSKDFVWETAIGNWADAMACVRRAKKFNKMGIYVQASQLTGDEITIIKLCSNNPVVNDFPNLGKFATNFVRKNFGIKDLGDEVFKIELRGPSRKLVHNKSREKNMPSMNKSEIILEKISNQAANQNSVDEKPEYYVVQQIFPNAVLNISTPFTEEQAIQCAKSTPYALSHIVKIVQTIDTREDVRKRMFKDLALIATSLSANPKLALTKDFDKMYTLLNELDKLYVD